MSAPTQLPGWLQSTTTLPLLFGEAPATTTVQQWGIAFGQNIYTPENNRLSRRIDNDRPYAGWLYLSGSLQYIHLRDDQPVRQDTLQLYLGLVGPSAGGEWLQNGWHNLLDAYTWNGWANQLHDEPTLGIAAERRWRVFSTPLGGAPAPSEIDFVPRLGVTLGNVATYASAGGILRLGKDIGFDFGPARNRPGQAGSDSFSGHGYAWYLYAGGDVQAWARNMFLDGNLDGYGAWVTRRPFVAEAHAGLVMVVDGVRVSFAYVFRTPEFDAPFREARSQQFGSINLTFRY